MYINDHNGNFLFAPGYLDKRVHYREHTGKEQKSAQQIVELIIKQSASVLIRPEVGLKQ